MSTELVSVVVLNYNGHLYVRRLMRSLLLQSYSALEIVVVDNGSTDGSLEIVEREFTDPRIRTLRLGRNRGFSAGNNAGMRTTHGAYVLLLNNDVELAPDCIEQLVAAARARPGCGALAPKILWFYRPEYIESMGTMCTPEGTSFNHGVGHVDVGQFDVPERVFGACFAAVLIPRAALDAVGRLEESYFMYYEDTDWCFRANRHGLPTFTVPDARVYHVHSGSLRHTGERRKRYLLTRNRLRFCLLNLPGTGRQLFALAKVFTPLRFWHLWLLPAEVWLRLRVGAHLLLRLPLLLYRRRQRLRDGQATVPANEFLDLYRGRESFFLPEEQRPEASLRALVSSMRELLRSRPTADNVVRLGHVLAIRHLLPWRPSAAVARTSLDAWDATLGDVPNRAEMLRFARSIPALDAALRGVRKPKPVWPWPIERRPHSRRLDAATFLLASVFAASGEVSVLRALGVVLTNVHYRKYMRRWPGVPTAAIEHALAETWRTAAAALPGTVRAAPDATAILARAERAFTFPASLRSA